MMRPQSAGIGRRRENEGIVSTSKRAHRRPRPLSAAHSPARVGKGAVGPTGSPQSPTSPTTEAFAKLLQAHQKHLDRQQGTPLHRRPVSASAVRTDVHAVESSPVLPSGGVHSRPVSRLQTRASTPHGLSYHTVPVTISGYEFLGELGKGSFGVVYKVRDKEDGSIYACKKVKVNHLDQHKQMAALDEVLNLRRVNHRNIVGLYAAFVEGNYLYIIMQWAERGDLSKMIKRLVAENGRFSELDIWVYFWELCRGIQHLHEHRIIHRDLKGLNVFLTKNNEIKIGDLGVSRMLRTETSQLERKVGTPLYLPPELVRNQPYDLKADIWTLGVLLYHLVALRPPFQGADNKRLMDSIIRDKPAPLPYVYSPVLSSMVMKLLDKDPLHRPSINEVISMFPEPLKAFFIKREGRSASSEPLPPLQVNSLRQIVKDLKSYPTQPAAVDIPLSVARPVSHYGRLESNGSKAGGYKSTHPSGVNPPGHLPKHRRIVSDRPSARDPQGRGDRMGKNKGENKSVKDNGMVAVAGQDDTIAQGYDDNDNDTVPAGQGGVEDPDNLVEILRAGGVVCDDGAAGQGARHGSRSRPSTAGPSGRRVQQVQQTRQIQVKQFTMESWRQRPMIHHNPRAVAVTAARRSPVSHQHVSRSSPVRDLIRPKSPLTFMPGNGHVISPSRIVQGKDDPPPPGSPSMDKGMGPQAPTPVRNRPTTAPVFRQPLPTRTPLVAADNHLEEQNFDKMPSPRRAQPFSTLRSHRQSRRSNRSVERVTAKALLKKPSVTDLAKSSCEDEEDKDTKNQDNSNDNGNNDGIGASSKPPSQRVRPSSAAAGSGSEARREEGGTDGRVEYRPSSRAATARERPRTSGLRVARVK